MKRDLSPDEMITAPIEAFCRMSGLGKTKVREMIKEGTLESFLIGKGLRMIVMDSYRRLIANGIAIERIKSDYAARDDGLRDGSDGSGSAT